MQASTRESQGKGVDVSELKPTKRASAWKSRKLTQLCRSTLFCCLVAEVLFDNEGVHVSKKFDRVWGVRVGRAAIGG
jgi:hypothetical protein